MGKVLLLLGRGAAAVGGEMLSQATGLAVNTKQSFWIRLLLQQTSCAGSSLRIVNVAVS